MATLSTLVKAIADIQGLEETQVAWIARHLREAGLISQGGRGRGGAQMTARDAVNLLIGVNAPGSPANVVATVSSFRELLVVPDYAKFDEHQDELFAEGKLGIRRGASLGDALEGLLSDCAEVNEGFGAKIVTLQGPTPSADIVIGHPSNPDEWEDYYFHHVFSDVRSASDRKQSTIFTDKTLAAVAAVIFN